jgi:ketosteroid isomerase-like protein
MICGVAQPAQLAELGEELVSAMSRGDLPALLERLHPEVEVREPDSLPYGGVRRGHAGFTEVLQIMGSLTELDITKYTVHPVDSGVILVLDVRFTSRSSGATIDTRVVEIDSVEAGLVRTMDLFYKDTAALLDFFARQASCAAVGPPA